MKRDQMRLGWILASVVLLGLLAESAHGAGDGDDDVVLVVNESDPVEWYQRGFALYDMDTYDEALICFEKALEIDPNYIGAWFWKGNALYSLGNYDDALKSYEKALELDPNYASAWFWKGSVLYSLGNYDDALKSYEKTLELDPNYVSAWYEKGDALYSLGDYDDALISYEKALELDPNCTRAWYGEGNAYYSLGNYDDALINYEKALELDPNFVFAWAGKGNALYSLGDYDDALISYEKTLELDPNYASAWYCKGNAHDSLGNYDDALKSYERALELDPNIVNAWHGKGNALRSLGKYDDALICYEKALEIDPNYTRAWYCKGNALCSLGDYDDALKSYDKALELDPSYVSAWYGEGDALYSLGDYDDALKSYDKALELDPNCTRAWYGEGNAHNSLGNYYDALINYEKALELDPNFVFAWAGKGSVLYSLGDYDDALISYEKALEIDSKDVYSRNGKGAALERLNRSTEAAMAYSLSRENELNSVTKIGIFAAFLLVLATAGYALSRRFRKYNISIIILSVNLLGFLTVMWLLSALFDFMLVGYFLGGGFLMIAISATLWSFSGFPLNPWMQQLVLSIENFKRYRSLRSATKLAFGFLSIEDFEKSRSFILPNMVLAFGTIAILAFIPVAGVFYFRFHLGTEISMVHFLEFAFLSIFLVGLFVTLPPILAAMLSENLDPETRNILLFLQFGHLGICGLYLGLILWIFEIGSFAHLVQLGDIKFPISPQFLGIMMSLFLLAILIPYISGSKRTSRWNATLLQKERSWLEELLDVLDFPTPSLYVTKLQKILKDIKDDETIFGQDEELNRIKSTYGEGVLRLDPRFRYRDFLKEQQCRIAEKIDQLEELGDQMEQIKETVRVYSEAYRIRRDEITDLIEREGQFKPKFWVALSLILTPVLVQIFATVFNLIMNVIESNLNGLITSPPALPLP